MTVRIAMWSGPRNISTAMMRSWENRSDCSVVDEPFYAYYLNKTQSPHPMFEEIIAAQPTEYGEVIEQLTQHPCETSLQYQKHMTHHMLPGVDLEWTRSLRHCFLIREPAYVVNSYTNSRGVCTSDDIGIVRQYELYETISELTGQKIPVVDTVTVLTNPELALRKICQSMSIPFETNMLQWPEGKRESDGVWASHWYHSVENSTGFAENKTAPFTLSGEQQRLVDELQPYYEKMRARAIEI